MDISLTVQSTAAGTGPAGGMAQTVISDYSDVAEEVEVTTNRMDTPGKMTFATVEGIGPCRAYGGKLRGMFGGRQEAV